MGKKKVVTKSGDTVDKKAASANLKRGKKHIESGRIYINASFNNTGVTVTDEKGGVIAWSTAGSLGFSGPKKATPFAASKVVAAVVEKISKIGLTNVEVIVSGVGSGRDSAIRSLINYGFNLTGIKDVTPVPHNGPRPKKVRRV
ncbi:MAG: 30S ribosomal protein S11 [bacterium]